MDKTLAARLSRIRAAAASRQPEGRGDGLQVKRADVCGAPAADGRTLPPASAPPAHSLLDGQTRPPPAHSLRDGQARPSTPEADFSSWEQLSPLALRRTVVSSLALPPLDSLSSGLGPLCPGSARVFAAGPPRADRLLFFDLETTGLSGGAGTVAFLAAFGRLRSAAAGTILGVSQYLLLDYSGEAEFLEAVRGELEGGEGGCDKPRLVSYNGRTFDSQILRTRFLMNAMPPVDPPHLDLVYPARRLWRRKLENCSLSTIERSALGLEREDDLPGSEAPDAWFGFLKTGDASRLLRVCEHNFRDLEGLASLLARVDAIARDPLGALDGAARAGFEKPDAEALALRFLAAAKASRQSGAAGGSASGAGGGAEREGERSQEALARALLERAASSGAPRAAFVLGTELAREGKAARAAELRALVAGSDGRDGKEAAAPGLRSAAYGLLAADARRRLGDPAKALSLLEAALSLEGLGEAARAGLERRRAAYAADAAAADADVASAAACAAADVASADASAAAAVGPDASATAADAAAASAAGPDASVAAADAAGADAAAAAADASAASAATDTAAVAAADVASADASAAAAVGPDASATAADAAAASAATAAADSASAAAAAGPDASAAAADAAGADASAAAADAAGADASAAAADASAASAATDTAAVAAADVASADAAGTDASAAASAGPRESQ